MHHKLSKEIRFQFYEVISDIVQKIEGDNDGRKINKIEKDLVAALAVVWNRRATKGIKSALKVLDQDNQEDTVTIKQRDQILSRLERGFNGIDKEVTPRLQKDYNKIYKINKKGFVSRFRLNPETKQLIYKRYSWSKPYVVKSVDQIMKVDANFSIVDERTIKELVSLKALSIGTHFDRFHRPLISDLINEAVIARGLPIAKASKFLEEELTKRLGGKASTAVPAAIVAQGKKAVESYFTNITAIHVNFARNFGQVNAMSEAGIARFQIAAVIDELTSTICTQMNGRVFEMKLARQHMTKVLQSKDVDALRGFAPFRRDLSEFNLSAGAKLEDPGAERVLAENGMSMPPYHGSCRTEVHPF